MGAPTFIRIDTSSFAWHTFTRRLPKVILEVTSLPGWSTDVQRRLATLRNSIPHGKIPPTLTRGAIDTKFWHAYLEERRDHTWIDLPFFEAEVIFYHLLLNAVGYHDESSRDPFAERKRAGLIMADQDAVRFSEQLQSELALSEEALPTALSISLWANKADLSQLAMATVPGKLLVDHRSRAVDILGSPRASSIVDIVLDNSGAEFLGDLVLADVLLRSGIHVRMHCKPSPFFVSDATIWDCHETIKYLQNHPLPTVRTWGRRLALQIEWKRLEFHTDAFWSRPLHFTHFPISLKQCLAEATLIVLKGDLNYRRYLEDRQWPHDQPLNTVKIHQLPPTVTLRVLKSEIMVGLTTRQSQALSSLETNWMYSGAYAAVQMFE